MALPHDLAEQTDAVVEATEPARINFNQALLEILDAYIRARRLIANHEVPGVDVYVSKRVYDLAEKAGLIKVLSQRFPEVVLRKGPGIEAARGPRPTHVIYDEAAGFEQ